MNVFLHYMALRQEDIHELQRLLTFVGLSSLGEVEQHVMIAFEAVMKNLNLIMDRSRPLKPYQTPVGYEEGQQLLDKHTIQLLGKEPTNHRVRIMVTMPSEAAENYLLVRDLLDAGMDCMRINCAYDDEKTWRQMIANLRRAERELNTQCKILMDLGGPKIRTGAISPGPQVLKWRPQRDTFGRVITPAKIWLVPEGDSHATPVEAQTKLPVTSGWLKRLKVGNTISFRDARNRSRIMTVTKADGDYRWAECERTCYLKPKIQLILRRGQKQWKGRVGDIPPLPQKIVLKKEDILVLTKEPLPGVPALYGDQGQLLQPARISCSSSQIYNNVKPGARIWFDDGKIGGQILSVTSEQMEIRITKAKLRGTRLAANKGINLPDSLLTIPALTKKDRQDLKFVAKHADIVGYSFVKTPDDIALLQSHLKKMKAKKLGIILKIETRGAFEILPKLLMAGMKSSSIGVMIARGDLAIECGYERLAEVQEEILWVCEAAHIPVIWATQVLENLAKTGQPSRAEITDASMAVRAECVMLNKGPFIIDALQTLDNILHRMSKHQDKKKTKLRRLKLSDLD